MSWQTLRDFIDARWAAAVAGYSGAVQAALKDGPVTAIARGIDDEGLLGAGGWSNMFSESYSFSDAAIVADRQAMVESSYGDGWWAHRPTANHASLAVTGGVLTIVYQGHGTEDAAGATFTAPGLCQTLGGRLTLRRGDELVLGCTVSLSNPADYDAGGEFFKGGPVLVGLHPGSATRSFVGVGLFRSSGPTRTVQGYASISGTAGTWSAALADDTFYTVGTELELRLAHDLTATYRWRKVGAGEWNTSASSRLAYGMAAYFAGFILAHGTVNNASTATISDMSMRIE